MTQSFLHLVANIKVTQHAMCI